MRDRNSDHRRPGKPPGRNPDRNPGKPPGRNPGKRPDKEPNRPPGEAARREENRRQLGGKRFSKPNFSKPKSNPKAMAWRGAPRDRDGPVVLYGWHTVKAALENPQRHFHRVLATENAVRRLTDDHVKF